MAYSDNDTIEEVHLEITNTTTGAFLGHEHYAPGAASYTLSKPFTMQRVKIEAHDATDNIAKMEIACMVH